MKANQGGTQEFGRGFNKTGEDQHTAATLFFLYFQAQPVGTVECHFDAGKKCHQEQGQDKKDDRVHGKHGTKIALGELKVEN